MEFSKRILYLSWLITAILTVFVVIGSVLGISVDNIVTLACLAYGEVTATHAFYYWKAKNENRIKLTRQMMQDWAEAYGVESVTALAEIILKE